MNRDDILAFVVTETLRAHGVQDPELTAESRRIAAQLRPDLGGQKHYVLRHPPALESDDERRRLIVQDAMTNMPTREVERKHGVSRSTVYRLLKVHARKA